MKTVIRVQDKYGRGMFQFGNNSASQTLGVYQIKELKNLANRHSEFPNAVNDKAIDKIIRKPNQSIDDVDYSWLKWRFSFKSISQFEKWVLREEVAILKQYGYGVYKIDAEIVEESEYQSIYDINSVVSITEITELFID